MKPQTEGFTVLEVLVAIALLGIIVLITVAPMGKLFRSSSGSAQGIQTSATAQQVIEQVKGSWRVQGNFDRTCIGGLTLPTGTTLAVQTLDENGAVTGDQAHNLSSNCSTAPFTPSDTPVTLKRVTVTSRTGETATTLVVDLWRPEQ